MDNFRLRDTADGGRTVGRKVGDCLGIELV